jgi:DNA-binding LacI/PurR family transcriptional regulator
VPVVLMMRTYPGLAKDAVTTDDLKGSFDAVSHLARVGHQRIALVGGPLNVSNGIARWQGYRKALSESGLKYDPELMYEGDYRIDSGYRAGLSLLTHRPDAVFVANYLMMVGFLEAAQEMGLRCPDDFGLVTLDDYPWLKLFSPPITAVELPKYEVGSLATELLLDRIKGKAGRGETRKIMPQLRVRESCGFRLRTRSLAVAGEVEEPVFDDPAISGHRAHQDPTAAPVARFLGSACPNVFRRPAIVRRREVRPFKCNSISKRLESSPPFTSTA